MNDPTYVERSSLGVRILSLDGCWLKISGRWGLKPINTRIDLRRASPTLLPVNVRLYPALIWVAFVALAPTVIVIAIPERYVPDHVVEAIMEFYAVFWMALMIWQGWRYLPKIDFVRIFSKQGKVLFDIVKDRNAADDYEAFLNALRARIESSRLS